MQHQIGILVVCLYAASHSATYFVATDGSNSAGGTSAAPYATFAKAFGAMSAGDSLIIKDGTYSERITGMPSGSAGKYTNIKAEHNFRVTVRKGNALNISNKKCVRVEGIKFDGNLNGGDCADVVASDHIKIIRCGFTGSEASAANWNIVTFAVTAGCSYVLVEECWAWGTGRYKFISYTSNNVIFRRCVARHDYHPSTQCACFHRYSSTNVEFQNCIALDCGLESGLNGHFYGGMYNDNHDPAVENTGKNLGCILLNLRAGCPIYDIRIWGTRAIEHCVVWDCASGMDLSNYNDGVTPFSPANAFVNHCTLGDLSDSGFAGGYGIFDEMAPYGKPMDRTSATNSIITKTSHALDYITASDYNCFYGNAKNYANTPAGSHDTTNNPGLQYITRAAAAAGNASDSGYRGATVEKRYGMDESLWGEEGYEALTDVNLWPWPNEAEIKIDMSSWNAQMSDGDFTSTGVSGTRGFCVNVNGLNGKPLTLTSYIWEYLGNPCPPDIYGSAETKTSAPAHKGTLTLNASPNPLRPGTECLFTIEEHPDVPVRILIYNASGKRIAALANSPHSPGKRTFIWRAEGLPAGIYIALMKVGSEVRQQQLVLAR